MTDEKFNIYTRRDGFFNKEFLNPIGIKIFNIFKDLKDYGNIYFHRINSISVTSQERTDNQKSSHYTNDAIDFIIDPYTYIPYYFGVLHACFPFNIYLGIPPSKLHIHIENFTNNLKKLEYGKSLLIPTGKNIDYSLEAYGMGNYTSFEDILTTIQNFGLFKDVTRQLYLTYFDIDNKLPLSYFCESPKLEPDNGFLIIAGSIALLYFLNKRGK